MEFLGVASFVGVRVPVIASRTDTDDATLASISGILPCHYGTVASNTEDLTTCAVLPCSMVVITTPIGTDVVLSCRVGYMVTSIGTVNLLCVFTSNEILL